MFEKETVNERRLVPLPLCNPGAILIYVRPIGLHDNVVIRMTKDRFYLILDYFEKGKNLDL